MRFLEQLTSLEELNGTVQGVVDGRHKLLAEAITQNIVRVLIRKDGAMRLDRTWSIAQGEAQVPLEGLDRLNLPGDRVTGELHDDTLTVGEIACRFHRSPYYLEWSYKEHPILAERTTGAVAFGRRGHRVWHFHQLKPESRFYGLGERSGEIDRRGRSFELRNVDPMGYDARTSDPLYKHIPFYIEHHRHGYLGVFYDNLATARFNFGEEIDNYHGPFTSYRAEDG
ncbi:MAG TPA: alpha-glucosidase, partial [Phycisphaerales bacterium]|nr:alpha-glucosidase [Phycisphaerales bacterium]